MGNGKWKPVSLIPTLVFKGIYTNINYRWEIRQSDFFAISTWTPGGALRGKMDVYTRADWGDTANWGCGRAKDLVKDMVSAINGWAGAFFGFISTDFCQD